MPSYVAKKAIPFGINPEGAKGLSVMMASKEINRVKPGGISCGCLVFG